MGKKLYVGNLPFSATDEILAQTFSAYGEVESAKRLSPNLKVIRFNQTHPIFLPIGRRQDSVKDLKSSIATALKEVEKVLFNDVAPPLIMQGKEGKYLAYGKTYAGRLLFIVWASKYKKTKIIIARDMTQKEKRFYRRRKE